VNWATRSLLANGYKKISSFTTSNDGVYALFIGMGNDYLYTLRFYGTYWGVLIQQGTKAWTSAAGVEIVREGQ
jgi:hypothetical protein